ncbi:toprim domain-containing protein [Pseudomonas sp. VE 196-7]|uniref:toprim domain-containing protein n=1 Tax=Pseudomonas sp. VE 196-7 TaxID=2956726 RepID=UPI0021D4CBAA|nr:toprim domain-containing protein [Pseudomonas sp. VE 196-7]MCU7215127.1 toprim domain-containing protein [Pseudomonas sp. VE 196-7]
MNARTRITSDQFEEIYQTDVVKALENDRELDFKDVSDKYLQKGTCPNCGQQKLFISREKPYRLKCNRDNECQFEQNTRERYSYLFENLSERFPATEANPNATADAYLKRNRGFDVAKLAGWYTQAKRKMKSGVWADTVRFPLCNGYWERIIDESMVAANKGDKAGIKFEMSYQNSGWTPPGQTIEKSDRVYVVEGIFHAIALHLAGKKAIASISCVNFPWAIVEANKGKLVTWVIGLDDDKAGHKYIPKYLKMLRGMTEIAWVALAGERDWDDVYRDGELDDKFLDDACYRGRLFTAESTNTLAYLLYLRRPAGFYLLEFRNQLYSARVNQADLSKDLGEDKVDGNREIFSRNVKIAQISNCIPSLDYLEKDIITGEQRYYFDFRFPDRSRSVQAPLPSSAIAEPRGFVRAMLDFTPGGNFEGGARELAMLKAKWLNDERRPVRTVRSLPFIGYDEDSGTYCYPQFGFHGGRELQVNSHGFIEVKGAGVKTALVNTKFERGTDFDPEWFPDFLAVHSLNGLAALSWWTASLFVQQIGVQQASFPFLELTGEPGAGKSTLLRFLWRLIGRDNMEGIKPSGTGASAVGLSRALSEVSNLPVVLIESDRTYTDAQGRSVTVQFAWDEMKTLYDYHAPVRVTGAKTTGNETRTSIWRGALAISQNETVDGSEAILSRIVHMHCTKDHHSLALKPMADRLKIMKAKELGGFLRRVLAFEKQWLERYFEAFPRYEKRLQSINALTEARIVQSFAQVLAAAYATQALFPTWTDRDTESLAKHLEARAIDRQQRCRSENPTAAKFWQIYHYLNEDVVTIIDAEGEREETRETLNHSIDKELIGINIEHFQQACRKAGQDVIPDTQLRRALATSTTHKFIETRKARSRLEKRSLWLWFFSKRGEAS